MRVLQRLLLRLAGPRGLSTSRRFLRSHDLGKVVKVAHKSPLNRWEDDRMQRVKFNPREREANRRSMPLNESLDLGVACGMALALEGGPDSV